MTDPVVAPVAYIIERISKAWGLTPADLIEIRGTGGNYRNSPPPPTVVCRSVAMMVAHDLMPHLPWRALGRSFQRDRTTIISNIRVARRYLDHHRLVAARVDRLKADIERQIAPRIRAGNKAGNLTRMSALSALQK